MSPFARLIRFKSAHDDKIFFADLGSERKDIPASGTEVRAYPTFEDLKSGINDQLVTIGQLLAPVPNPELPIYCCGLNYKAHAKEVNIDPPQYPPLWTKPKAALANPGEDIPINKYCAENRPDYEGELVFMTSRECRDISIADAPSYILGYTIGNDISCRTFQKRAVTGGQMFYAKAFDKFAPMGPLLLSFDEVARQGGILPLTTKVNGEQVQSAECPTDFIYSPAVVLSHMSQGTTIPAYTAIMTGTPSGIGLYRNGGTFLTQGDVVEIEIGGIGVLKNRIVLV